MANEMLLIDPEPIKKFIVDGLNNPDVKEAFGHDAITILAEIEYAPTIEAEPVVHAYWQLYNETSDDYWKRGWRCSHCKGYHFHNGAMIKKYKRCPNCGAHMDLKEADHEISV